MSLSRARITLELKDRPAASLVTWVIKHPGLHLRRCPRHHGPFTRLVAPNLLVVIHGSMQASKRAIRRAQRTGLIVLRGRRWYPAKELRA